MPNRQLFRVKALKTIQGNGIELYLFFIPGKEIFSIAQISRLHRDDTDKLEGFQRKGIRDHVKKIVEYLDADSVLFPNAILIAMSSEIEFKKTRGPKPRGVVDAGDVGVLEIPLFVDDDPVAWIVDGQQRSLALNQSKNGDLPVPVVAFVSDNVEVQREQFILVNKARPLPSRLINELLPEMTTVTLPRDLAPRRIPSELCNLLNQDTESPFFRLIRRVSTDDEGVGVIIDTALINVMKRSINNPLGALAPYKTARDGAADIGKMYENMRVFWEEVKKTFPDAWGIAPTKSRLMHSAGIQAMGYFMDKVMGRAVGMPDPSGHILKTLNAIAPYCRWTEGTWEGIGIEWNQIQNTSKHIRLLADTLMQLDYRVSCES